MSLMTIAPFSATSTPTTLALAGMLPLGSRVSGGTKAAISVGSALVRSIARSPLECPATNPVEPRATAWCTA